MSRLLSYINETDEDISKKCKKMKRECSQYIRDIQSSKKILVRGMDISTTKTLFKKSVRKNRQPRNTPPEMHEFLDDMFLKKFGWKARSEGVFASINEQMGSIYGYPFVIFPVGNYKLLWSPLIRDLLINLHLGKFHGLAKEHHIEFSKIPIMKTSIITPEQFIDNNPQDLYYTLYKGQISNGLADSNVYRASTEQIFEMLSIYKGICRSTVDTYKEESSIKEITPKREIVVKCDAYYAIKYHMIDIIKNEIGLK
jgi:hypothetical protein